MGPLGSGEGSAGSPSAQWGPLDAPGSYPAWVSGKGKGEGRPYRDRGGLTLQPGSPSATG